MINQVAPERFSKAFPVFDIGGTFLRFAIVEEGNILTKQKFPTPKDPQEATDSIIRLLKEYINHGGVASKVVIGLAGTLSRDGRSIHRIPQLPRWNGFSLVDTLESALGVSVRVVNDAVLGALGEAHYGSGKGYAIVGYITIGTSVGGARVVNGSVDANAHGFEPGHQIISWRDGVKLCDVVGGATLQNKAKKQPIDIEDSMFWEEQSKILATGILNSILLWSPDVVVVGGSVGRRMSMRVIESYISEHSILFEDPRIVRGSLGDDAGLLGGSLIV